MSERNQELFDKIAARIEEEPHRYDQTGWSIDTDEEDNTLCDTAHCVAGWAIVLTYGVEWFDAYDKHQEVPIPDGLDPDDLAISTVAASLLGLDPDESTRLFAAAWSPEGYDIEDNKPPIGVVADTLRDIGRGGEIVSWES